MEFKVSITNDKGIVLTKIVKGVTEESLLIKIVAMSHKVDYSFYRIKSVEPVMLHDDTQSGLGIE